MTDGDKREALALLMFVGGFVTGLWTGMLI